MHKPIGYYRNCDDAICASCAPRGYAEGSAWVAFEGWTEPIAIMSYTESDTPTHCEECRILIPHALTDYGFLYVSEAIAAYIIHGQGDFEVVAAWAAAYPEALDLAMCLERLEQLTRKE